MTIYDAIVIGGGQAGLAAGYYLKQKCLNFIILDEQKQAGAVWRKRYDSLVLFTPRAYSSLPGFDLEGEAEGFPSKDEIAYYLKSYVKKFDLPIQYEEQVVALSKKQERLYVETETKVYEGKHAIIATGAFHDSYRPSFAEAISPNIEQLHASEYRNPKQIRSEKVLIVGGGNTGIQIAAELSETYEVTLATSKKVTAIPEKIFGKSLFWWLEHVGLENVRSDSRLGQLLKKRDPIIGSAFKKVKLQASITERLVSFQDKKAIFANGDEQKVQTIIWATGYRNRYQWLGIDGTLDRKGRPIHQRGRTAVNGLYFLGLSWQSRRSSALIYGVGKDAKEIVDQIVNKEQPPETQ